MRRTIELLGNRCSDENKHDMSVTEKKCETHVVFIFV